MEISEEQIKDHAEDAYQQGVEEGKRMQEEPSLAVMQEQQAQQLNIYKLDVSEFLSDVSTYLRGEIEVYDSEGKPKGKQIHKAAINKDGMGLLMQIISSHVNKHAFLSYLDTQMVGRITQQINDELIVELEVNKTKWGISNAGIITDCVCNVIYFALSRAIAGRENKLISTSLSQIESFSKTAQPKSSVMSSIGSFLRPKRRG